MDGQTDEQTDGQRENVTPPALAIAGAEAQEHCETQRAGLTSKHMNLIMWRFDIIQQEYL